MRRAKLIALLGAARVDPGAPTPDANTIRPFRERLIAAGALDALFADFDRWTPMRVGC